MKKIVALLIACTAVLPTHAQLFGPESVTGAALGGIAGGIIGHNNGRQTGEGIAIGAGAGLLLGSLVGYRNRERENRSGTYPTAVYASPYYYPVSYVYQQPVVTPVVPPAPAAPQVEQGAVAPPAVTETLSTRPNPMAGANSLFGR